MFLIISFCEVKFKKISYFDDLTDPKSPEHYEELLRSPLLVDFFETQPVHRTHFKSSFNLN